MSDRALLEMAAKAAGYNVRWHEIFECFVHVGPFNITNPPTMAGQRLVWVPLDDDGDALRLAVKLRIQVTPGTYNKDEFSAYNGERHAEAHEWYAPGVQDECAATRRAITRAAAEIGKGMP